MYDLKPFSQRLSEIEDWLKQELAGIRTGQASTALLDGISVDVYGAKTPLNQVASISIEDAKTIRIAPWDASTIPDIEKSITIADLGISTAADDQGVRVIFPDMTTESREKFAKVAKGKVEEARISVRNERNKVSSDIDSQKKASEMSEDDAKRSSDEMQKNVDAMMKSFDELGKQKEADIMSI